MGAFGEKLRKQREQRGIALDAISNTTKISTRMLRALEDEHFDQLPGGVFNKGFVRAYARQVGLDEEEAITDYLAALRESQIQQQSILPDFRGVAVKSGPAPAPGPGSQEARTQDLSRNDLSRNDLRRNDLPDDSRGQASPGGDGSDRERKPHAPAKHRYPAGTPAQVADQPSAPIPWGTLAAALLLVTMVLAFWNFRRHAAPKAASLPAAVAAQPPAAPAPFSAPAATPQTASTSSLTAGKPSSVGTLSGGTLMPGTISSGTPSPRPPLTAAGATPASSGAAPSSKTAASNTPGSAGSAPSKPAARPAAAAAKPPSTFTVLIRAEKTTWVSIVADGKPVAEETLIAPAHTSVRASHEVYVRAGNAAGVSFLLNGKEFPAQGNDGEVKTYIFDATGVRVEPQPQTPATNR